jgi:chromosome segregation ATPase
MMGLLEYVLFQYKRRVTDCLNNPQGGSEESKALAEAQVKLEELQKAAADLQVQLALQREEEAKATAAHNSLLAAEAEATAAANEFQRQEDEHKKKISSLEAKSTDASIGTVSRNKAVQELAQAKGEDPLPLRRAKITQVCHCHTNYPSIHFILSFLR